MRPRLTARLSIALAVSASGGSDPGRTAGGTGGSIAPDAAAENRASPGETPPSDEEIAWVGRMIDWARRIGEPVEATVAIASVKRPSPEARAELRRALAAVSRCTAMLDDIVGEPPSRRLAHVNDTLRGACDRFRTGARVAVRALAGRGDPDDLLATWENDRNEAFAYLVSASEAVADYQPAKAKKLG